MSHEQPESASLIQLQEAMRRGAAVLVVGAGVSISASSNEKCASWIGFIEESLNYVSSRGLADAKFVDAQRALLDSNRDDTYVLLQVAGAIRHSIAKRGEQAEANWLKETIGDLPLKAKEIALALGSLACPLLTTNYDTLLEEALGRQSVSWKDTNSLQGLVANNTPSIGHIHGIWNDPNSVILSEVDYLNHGQHGPTQALERALTTLKSIVYIGFGAGLDDPNFDRLFKWHRTQFTNTQVRHYRLGLSTEVEALKAFHVDDAVDVISYGDDYADLAGFLSDLKPNNVELSTGIDIVGVAHNAIADQIRQETIVGEVVGELPSRSIEELVVPPVLLPLPQDEYRRLKNDPELSLERSAPLEVASSQGVIIICGEDQAGVTTTLRWLLSESTKVNPSSVPLYVDFKNFQKSVPKPMDAQLRLQASIVGVTRGTREPLPKYIAAVDNMTVHQGKTSDRALAEISGNSSTKLFLGCRQGEERDLIERLSEYQISPQIHYIGRLSTRDISDIAALVDPGRAKLIAKSVAALIRHQSLPRNPFTVALLISIFVKGDDISANTSHTSVLDQYVSLLLGRGDPAEDARYDYDSVQREAVLADLAMLFYDQHKGVIVESDVLRRIESFFERYGWQGRPREILDSFYARRVLRNVSGSVRFAHESYLALFLAKAALADERHMSAFLSDPLALAPVIKHYAALKRTSGTLIGSMSDLLDRWVGEGPVGEAYRSLELSAPPSPDEDSMSLRQPRIDTAKDEGDDLAESFDLYDLEVPSEEVAFPLQLPEEIPDTLKFSIALDVVSSVIRDSDQVADLSAKKQLLIRVLLGWGNFLDFTTSDATFRDSFHQVAEAASDTMGLEGEKREAFIAKISEWFPPILVISGISSSLSSRILARPLGDVIDSDSALREDIVFAVPAAMMLIDLQPEGWVRRVQYLLEPHLRAWVVREFLKESLATIYLRGRTSVPADDRQLVNLVAELHAAEYKWSNSNERKGYVSRIGQAFEKRRLGHLPSSPAVEDFDAEGNDEL